MQAVDRGNPPLSSSATIRVQVVDVNDNSPAIPPMEPVLISESKADPVALKWFFYINNVCFDLILVFLGFT